MPKNFEQDIRIADEIAVLDLDRTLMNTSFVTSVVLSALSSYSVSSSQIKQAIEYVESQAGNSFFLFDYIEKSFTGDVLATLINDILNDERLLEETKENLLCSGAENLITALEERAVPQLILTYGEANYQEFKTALFRKLIGKTAEELPAIVTSAANKSQWVSDEWFHDGIECGEIAAEVMGYTLRFNTLTIIDDKVENLVSADERVMGIFVDNRSVQSGGVLSTAEVAGAVEAGVRLSELASLYGDR